MAEAEKCIKCGKSFTGMFKVYRANNDFITYFQKIDIDIKDICTKCISSYLNKIIGDFRQEKEKIL